MSRSLDVALGLDEKQEIVIDRSAMYIVTSPFTLADSGGGHIAESLRKGDIIKIEDTPDKYVSLLELFIKLGYAKKYEPKTIPKKGIEMKALKDEPIEISTDEVVEAILNNEGVGGEGLVVPKMIDGVVSEESVAHAGTSKKPVKKKLTKKELRERVKNKKK